MREFPKSNFGKLVKFMTASDLLTVQSIDVRFIKYENEFFWRPIARTCSPSLELPTTYDNICKLRKEFTDIICQNNWKLSIIWGDSTFFVLLWFICVTKIHTESFF